MISKRRARKCLQELAAVINTAGNNGTAVRDIVSALRGPDGEAITDDNYAAHVKAKTTAIIRRQIGLGGNCGLAVAPIGKSLENFYHVGGGPVRLSDEVNTEHFVSHIRRAWAALEMLGLAEKELLPARAPVKKKETK